MGGKILFGWVPEWQEGLMRGVAALGLEAHMARLDREDPAGFDAVVPLTLPGQAVVERWRAEGRAVRALAIPGAVRALCHDKLALNRALAAKGFGRRLPAEVAPDRAVFPVVFKQRQAAWGQGVRVLDSPTALDAVRGALADGTGFLQAYVPGDEEYAVHLLRQGGRTLFRATIHYRMAGPGLVKGTGAAPVQRTWLPSTPHAPLWDRICDAIGLTEGTACIDYRLTPEGPVLFEINPRIGGSLTQRAGRYLTAYLRAVGAGGVLAAAG